MFKLDDNLLHEVGLGTLPPHEKNRMLNHIYETLEMRVGMKLAEQMSNEQLDEFERFIDGDIVYARGFLDQAKPGWATSQEYQTQLQNAQASAVKAGVTLNENAVVAEFGALSWLETNFPGYKQVVADELDKLKTEIKNVAPQIISASAAQAAQHPQASVPGQPYAPPSGQQPPQPQYSQQPPQTYGQPVPPPPAAPMGQPYAAQSQYPQPPSPQQTPPSAAPTTDPAADQPSPPPHPDDSQQSASTSS